MSVQNTDLLLVQRGTQPYRETSENLATYINSEITLGTNGDIPITSSSVLGVLKVGNNLNVEADGTVNAVTPSGLEFQGVWSTATQSPATGALTAGNFYIWNGGAATLTGTSWGSLDGDPVAAGDRLAWTASDDWELVPFAIGGAGVTSVTGTAPIFVDSSDADSPDVSITNVTTTADGAMTKEDKVKLDGIASGAQVNVSPTQTYTQAATEGTLTLSPGGDTTQVPVATTTNAGLMSATDKTTLDGLSSSTSGVSAVTGGTAITIGGTAAVPIVNVDFGSAPNGTPVSAMPYDISMLGDLP